MVELTPAGRCRRRSTSSGTAASGEMFISHGWNIPALSQNCQPHATRRMRRWMNRRIFRRKPALDGSDEYSSCNASRRNS